MLVGIALGVVIAFAVAVSLFPRGGGDGIALASATALMTLPSTVAFVATTCLARAALRPQRRIWIWLVLVVGMLPAVVIVGDLVEGIVYDRVESWGPSQGIFRTQGPGFLVLREGLIVLVGATLGAAVGLGLAGIGGGNRDAVLRGR
jgi:hypothetical protein